MGKKDLEKEVDLSQFRENNRYEAKLAKGGLPSNIWDCA